MYPKISVILPAFNAKKFLAQSIESILGQTYTNFELIVINDGSTDGTTDIIDSYDDPRIVSLNHKHNQGLIYTLNHGLNVAQGDLIARQDADDLSLPERLATQVRFFEQNPEAVIIGSAYHEIDESGQRIQLIQQPINDSGIRWQMLFHNGFLHSSIMFKVSIVRQYNLTYSIDALHTEDYDLWTQLMHYGQGLNIEEPLVLYRVHSNQVSQVFNPIQRQNADRISWHNIQQLGVDVSLADVSTLRRWYYNPPDKLNPQSMALYIKLFNIIYAFRQLNNIDPVTIQKLQQLWIKRVFFFLPAKQIPAFFSTGLLIMLFKIDAQQTIRCFQNRLFHWIRKGIF